MRWGSLRLAFTADGQMRQEPAQIVCTIQDMAIHHNSDTRFKDWWHRWKILVSSLSNFALSLLYTNTNWFRIRKQVSHLLYDGTEKKSYMVEDNVCLISLLHWRNQETCVSLVVELNNVSFHTKRCNSTAIKRTTKHTDSDLIRGAILLIWKTVVSTSL